MILINLILDSDSPNRVLISRVTTAYNIRWYIRNWLGNSNSTHTVGMHYIINLSCLKEARYKIIQNDGFSWKNHIRTYRHDISIYNKMILGHHATFFCYMHLKISWNSSLAPKSLFIYDVIISCLKAWFMLLTTKNWFFSKDNYFCLLFFS